jgi:diguanylate cyclase (GGDEF)-like protein
MVSHGTIDLRRFGILSASYVALAGIGFFAYTAFHAHAGVIAVIPLLFIAYYLRLRVAIITAAISGALFGFLDRDVIPGGGALQLPPIVDALMLAVVFCIVVFVAERLRASALQNALLRESLHHARTQAQRDALTGIPNRAYFLERLRASVNEKGPGDYVGILFADLDGFKAVNDTAGHITGDRVLVLVAERLRHAVRADDILARIGGDEFAILIDQLPNSSEAETLAEKLEAQFVNPFHVDGTQFRIGVTVGVSIAPPDGVDAESLLRVADARMYRRKEEKRSMLKR